jgi:hypothetical protein
VTSSKFFLFALLAIAATAAGCHKPARTLAPISGKVTYHGEALRFGTVVLQPEAGQFATGVIQPDGTFQMTTLGEGFGVPLGKNKVSIACFEGQNPKFSEPTAANGGPPRERFRGKSLIPSKYLSFDTSGILVNVRRGVNDPLLLNLTD